jgi:hypothetical protein
MDWTTISLTTVVPNWRGLAPDARTAQQIAYALTGSPFVRGY